MGDISCAKCGEPWDAYGVKNGDMEDWEAKKFMAGEGCPSCKFGMRCNACKGTGKYRWGISDDTETDEPCRICKGLGKIEEGTSEHLENMKGFMHSSTEETDDPDAAMNAWNLG